MLNPPRPSYEYPTTTEALRKAASESRKIFVYQFGGDPNKGFGADYLGFLRRLMICLQYGVGFRFGRVRHPIGYVTLKGWTDYFMPFCEEVDAPLLEWLNVPQFPYARRFPLAKIIAGAWLRLSSRPRSNYFMFDEVGELKYWGSPSIDENAKFLSDRKKLIDILWNYNPETEDEVETLKEEIAIPDRYYALCIRRGDKIQEHPYIEVERYAERICSLSDGVKDIFVATDDSRVIDKIAKVLPNRELLTLTEPRSHGYDHRKFKALPSAERRRRTIRLFAQLEIIKRARIFFGSKTTNVAWLANAHRGGNGVLWVD